MCYNYVRVYLITDNFNLHDLSYTTLTWTTVDSKTTWVGLFKVHDTCCPGTAPLREEFNISVISDGWKKLNVVSFH